MHGHHLSFEPSDVCFGKHWLMEKEHSCLASHQVGWNPDCWGERNSSDMYIQTTPWKRAGKGFKTAHPLSVTLPGETEVTENTQKLHTFQALVWQWDPLNWKARGTYALALGAQLTEKWKSQVGEPVPSHLVDVELDLLEQLLLHAHISSLALRAARTGGKKEMWFIRKYILVEKYFCETSD